MSPYKLKRRLTGFTEKELVQLQSQIPVEAREVWSKYHTKEVKTKEDIEESFVRHVETTLSRSIYNCDTLAAYQAISNTIRDKLILRWNMTQQLQTQNDQKRVYYFSLEFLMGRAMDNAIENLDMKSVIDESMKELSFNLEDLLDEEPDAALGNGGLGRLAACFMDSLSTGKYPSWGYGLRYDYGIFAQKIIDGYQVEMPDYWLKYSNPWELSRVEIRYPVNFYGGVVDENGKKRWVGGEQVLAVAYDYPIPGYKVENVNNLRLWTAKPTTLFDFNKFNQGDYKNSVDAQQRAEAITSVLYPNDNFDKGKELRLKQQYFWVCASLQDILRRFKKTMRPWKELSDQVAIQLNDTHPTLAIIELQRILVDEEDLEWEEAWPIVVRTFGYTNHTVMKEALEAWPVPIFANLLPRHMEIVYLINYYFLEYVRQKFPNDDALLSRVSIIDEAGQKSVRMAHIAVIGSHKVNGVADLHSSLIKTTIFKDFVDIYGANKFINVTNGITPRRWLKQSNPELCKLITSKLGSEDYLQDLYQLKGLEKFIDDAEFRDAWQEVKNERKRKLADLINELTPYNLGLNPEHYLFDIQVKRMHEYKRQQLNIFGVIYRYLQLKSLTPAERKQKYTPKVSIIGGKAAPGYYMAKSIIKLINNVSEVVNHDPDTNEFLKCVFIPDYNVSKAQIIIPASDVSEHISTAGTEASGTSNMKFVLNGGLLIGTLDGATVEIAKEIGEENVFLFGHVSEDVDSIRASHHVNGVKVSDKLQKVFDAIDQNVFRDRNEFLPIIDTVRYHGDYYLTSDDFDSYIETQDKIDTMYKEHHDLWVQKSIISVANMGFFSSDRCIDEYAELIWNVEKMQ